MLQDEIKEISGTGKNDSDLVARNQVHKALNVIVITMGVSPIVQPLLQSRHCVVGIIECAPRKGSKIKRENHAFRLARWIYALLRKKPLSLKNLALEKGIPYFYMNDGSSEVLENWVKALNSDLIVIFSMSQLLKKNVFSIPPHGAINLHPALLPKYRGPNPWFWMYYDNDLHPGVTIHYIDEGEDTGDVIYQEGFDIAMGAPFQDVNEKAISNVGARLLVRAVDDIAAGSAPRIPQPKESPTRRARNVKPEEGTNLINWEEWPGHKVWHFLRGAAQWTDIISNFEASAKGRCWEIGDYETGQIDRAFQPGKIYSCGGKTFLACRDGRIVLNKRFNIKRFIAQLLRN